jgi:hypothetical protein
MKIFFIQIIAGQTFSAKSKIVRFEVSRDKLQPIIQMVTKTFASCLVFGVGRHFILVV